jgi:phage recombination protein Bet
MSNEIAQRASMPAMQMDESELMNVLRNSLYPGAQDDSIKLAVSYCKAAGLDIMQKPVHLVPMWDNKAKRNKDVIMPGIGLYRTQAARSGAYAGVTEPEFGAEVTETFPEEVGYENKRVPAVTVTFPASCKVIVKRLMPDGQLAEFAATERWKENYATAGKNSKQPNSMWARRPYAQLAKCAEAQALRKAFPEVGSAPTADEMEGKEIDMGSVDRTTGEVTPPPARTELPQCPDAKLDRWIKNVQDGTAAADELLPFAQGRYTLTAEQVARVNKVVADIKNPPIDGEAVEHMEGAEQ